MSKKVYAVPRLAWRRWIGRIDLEPVIGGFGNGISEWKLHKEFSGDLFFRLHLPTKGSFSLRHLGGRVRVEPGFVYWIPAYTPFTFEPETPCDHYWLHFVSHELSTLPALKVPHALPVSNLAREVKAWQSILNAMPQAKTLRRALAVREQLLKRIVPFLENALQALPPEQNDGEGFDQVLDYIDRHLSEPLRTADLLQFTDLKQSQFSAHFQAMFRLSPKKYVMQRRILLAKELLSRTPLLVKEVAHQCGYDNPFFFSRIFRKYAGVSPEEYRRLHRA